MNHNLIFFSHGVHTKQTQQLLKCELQKLDKVIWEQQTILIVLPPQYQYLYSHLKQAFIAMGFSDHNIQLFNDLAAEYTFDFIYVHEGNTFLLLNYLKQTGAFSFIQRLMKDQNTIYIGASAGCMVAGSSIHLALDFEDNITSLSDFTGLSLFDGNVIPHYTKQELKRYLNYKRTHNEPIGTKTVYHVSENGILVL